MTNKLGDISPINRADRVVNTSNYNKLDRLPPGIDRLIWKGLEPTDKKMVLAACNATKADGTRIANEDKTRMTSEIKAFFAWAKEHFTTDVSAFEKKILSILNHSDERFTVATEGAIRRKIHEEFIELFLSLNNDQDFANKEGMDDVPFATLKTEILSARNLTNIVQARPRPFESYKSADRAKVCEVLLADDRIGEAEAFAKRLDSRDNAPIQAQICKAWVKQGNLVKAQQAMEKISNGRVADKSAAMAAICTALLSKGKLHEAIDLARKIPSISTQREILTTICGKIETLTDANDLFFLIDKLPREYVSNLISSIASKGSFDLAIEVTMKFPKTLYYKEIRNRSFYEIITALCKAERFDKAWRVAAEVTGKDLETDRRAEVEKLILEAEHPIAYRISPEAARILSGIGDVINSALRCLTTAD